MLLEGKLSQSVEIIHQELKHACVKIENEIRTKMSDGLVKTVSVQLYSDLSTMHMALYSLCKQDKTSSQATSVLLRTIIESCISVFAFCKNPEDRAKMYWNFSAVLDWKLVCLQEKYIGCPLVRSEDKIKEKKCSAKRPFLL
jgi:hypothetical protein